MAMVMSIVNLSLTLPVPYNRHDLSLPTYGLHEVFYYIYLLHYMKFFC